MEKINYDLKNNINQLEQNLVQDQNQLKKLEKEFNNIKQINDFLEKNNKDLKINENKYQDKIKEYENINENSKKVIDDLNKTINQKDEELKKLKEDWLDLKNNLNSQNKTFKKSEIMSVNFSSSDGYINYSIPCIDSDIFAEIEEKLYKKYPNYREYNNIFLYKGSCVLRFKTIAENKIENGDPIILNVI